MQKKGGEARTQSTKQAWIAMADRQNEYMLVGSCNVSFLNTFDSWHYVQKIWNLISYFVDSRHSRFISRCSHVFLAFAAFFPRMIFVCVCVFSVSILAITSFIFKIYDENVAFCNVFFYRCCHRAATDACFAIAPAECERISSQHVECSCTRYTFCVRSYERTEWTRAYILFTICKMHWSAAMAKQNEHTER